MRFSGLTLRAVLIVVEPKYSLNADVTRAELSLTLPTPSGKLIPLGDNEASALVFGVKNNPTNSLAQL
ncbi:hypothetical protein J6590_071625 [Homalodisca vitripennis]|nr:hypothetical protein J6590_071625 [Homalodisca vitripennis]